jgi:hypothetical protein
VEYAYVTTDGDGNERVIKRGEYGEGESTPDVGDSVTLTGEDGVERAWKIARKVEVAYTGETLYVEPLE